MGAKADIQQHTYKGGAGEPLEKSRVNPMASTGPCAGPFQVDRRAWSRKEGSLLAFFTLGEESERNGTIFCLRSELVKSCMAFWFVLVFYISGLLGLGGGA